MDNNPNWLSESQQFWDNEAATFDNEPDHGLRDPQVQAAWTAVLKEALPPAPAAILDIGCGTGSLSLIMAELGYTVTGIDLSPAMIERAKAKVAGANFHIMDAAHPQFSPQSFDVILCRHLLWALPETDQVLQRWIALLKPGGRLILIEGFWQTGVGLHAQQIVNAMPAIMGGVSVKNLSDNSALWGHAVSDERYIVTASLGE